MIGRGGRGWLFLVACVGVLSFAGEGRAQGVELFVWPLPPSLGTGDTLALQLRLNSSGAAFNAYAVTLHYDTTALRFLPRSRSLQEGGDLAGACGSSFYRFQAGGDSVRIENSLLCNQQSLIGPALLLDLRFVVIGPEQVTWVRASSVQFFLDGLFVTPVVVHDGKVQIVTTLSVPGQGAELRGPRLTASPNPARGTVAFALESAPAGDAEVVVCDLAGRVVTRLVIAGGSGRAVATWNGRGDDGRPLPAGVYSAVVRTASGTARTRFIRLR